MPKQQIQQSKKWYAVHTYSGFEEAVAHNLKQRVKALEMEDKIFDILVPKEKKIKVKNGKKEVVEEKIYPGYILVNMIVTDDSWYVVRNTPHVTGFIGAGTTPVPISDEEIKRIQQRMGVEEPEYKIEFKVGDMVEITDGPFKDMTGNISKIDQEKGRVEVLVDLFGRETPVEVDSVQVKKV